MPSLDFAQIVPVEATILKIVVMPKDGTCSVWYSIRNTVHKTDLIREEDKWTRVVTVH
ncbi:hypothetical protein EVB32_293 [Rhizobium phage RHph_TM39]|uniref:Uncharacterized protein n=2 Tax=Cuauhnahuacvirus TaxID=3044696 RepID=A0A7S5UXG6_9CAUD|nr:hypothetical protein PQC16_gp349 [Rhizobium phage RHph_TM30]YP_010671440.1 hypothetical protein PQC17_gp350 [Rhizobium phage RHph_Y65]QIG71763.1 hypothetical protein EVB94_312 [Rhizobium phage RHph_TM40]QIG72124.1 hypothetical protein EVB95_310 [Rhizobium phage RHph_TM2_3B]QIG72486.1 hypothetical protein EVB96_310 [Rhizobium phage RHph_TM3_3_6]QIG77261.1 hypothetical protein EVB32_293 [Rhizobium phage RHph_TM39]QIG77554.1 hypothetical protein EVB61_248 [Rhizobium phage RHph_TM21B]QIG77876